MLGLAGLGAARWAKTGSFETDWDRRELKGYDAWCMVAGWPCLPGVS